MPGKSADGVDPLCPCRFNEYRINKDTQLTVTLIFFIFSSLIRFLLECYLITLNFSEVNPLLVPIKQTYSPGSIATSVL